MVVMLNNVCLLCSGEHCKDYCNSDIIKCADCGGPHLSSSSCEYLKEAKEVERLVSEGKSFQDAKKIIIQSKRNLFQKSTRIAQNTVQDMHNNKQNTTHSPFYSISQES